MTLQKLHSHITKRYVLIGLLAVCLVGTVNAAVAGPRRAKLSLAARIGLQCLTCISAVSHMEECGTAEEKMSA